VRRNRVLVPLDGSGFGRTALPPLRSLLRPADPEIVLLHVVTHPERVGEIDELSRELDGWGPIQRWLDGDPIRSEVAAAVATLGTVQGTLEASGFSVTAALRFGDPARRIVELIEAWGIDLVVMATHGRATLPKLVLGSVAEQVLRAVEIPVMMVRPQREGAVEALPLLARRPMPSAD
jgi:nucleotide-binding universal stress UspA family protein